MLNRLNLSINEFKRSFSWDENNDNGVFIKAGSDADKDNFQDLPEGEFFSII